MSPKVSIIVPCYKVEQYLDRCVKSLVNQTLEDIEIILVDDGSPDSVPEMCDRWAEQDTRIKVVHKKNEGLGMACNSGLEVATGEYVAFVDSDDWVDKEMYKDIYEAAQMYMAEIVFTGLRKVNIKQEVTYMEHPKKQLLYLNQNIKELIFDMIASDVTDPIERHIQMSAKVAIYKREILINNNIHFENEKKLISEDLLFNIDSLLHCNSAIVLPVAYYNYFFNDNSISHTHNVNKLQEIEFFYKELKSRYYQLTKYEEYNQRVNRLILGYFRSYMKSIVSIKNMSASEKIRILKITCNSKLLHEVGAEYDIKQMPIINRMIFYLSKYKCAKILYIIISISLKI